MRQNYSMVKNSNVLLEPCEGKLSCTVLRGESPSNGADLLDNENLVAGLADGARNVLRVKSAFKSFKQETNLSVITEDGSYYTFSAPIIGA